MSCSSEHDHHRDPPDHEHRPEVLERRDRHAEDPARAHHQHLARVAQVAGEEDDEPDLRELGGLEHEQARDADAEVGAVGLVADRRAGAAAAAAPSETTTIM